jgi:hypothetical protein
VSLPTIPDAMPLDWSGAPQGLRVSLVTLNEFGLPLDPRTMATRLPADPADREAFAQAVGETVRNTILLILGEQFYAPRDLPQ